jgi:hypothetical protein
VFPEEFEVGWRAAGALRRENEGPLWMRRHTIQHRMNENIYAEDSAGAWKGRPRHQMM